MPVNFSRHGNVGSAMQDIAERCDEIRNQSEELKRRDVRADEAVLKASDAFWKALADWEDEYREDAEDDARENAEYIRQHRLTRHQLGV